MHGTDICRIISRNAAETERERERDRWRDRDLERQSKKNSRHHCVTTIVQWPTIQKRTLLSR